MIDTRVCTDMIDCTMLLAWSHRRGLEGGTGLYAVLVALHGYCHTVVLHLPPSYVLCLAVTCQFPACFACGSVGLHFLPGGINPARSLNFYIRTIYLFLLIAFPAIFVWKDA